MTTLRDFLNKPGVDKDPDVARTQFFNDVVKKSPKYQGMSDTEKQSTINKLFPEGYAKTQSKVFLKRGLPGAYKQFKELPGIKQGDIAVEKFAKFVEPKVPAGRTTLGLYTKDLPRQVLADFARGYKPSTALPFISAFKLAKPAIKAVGKPALRAIGKITPEPVKKTLLKQFTVGKGLPKSFQELTQKARLERGIGAREAEEVARKLSVVPKGGLKIVGKSGTKIIKEGKQIPLEEQRYIGRIFRKEVIESPALKASPKYQQLKSISDEGRAIMDKWSTSLAKSGIPKEQTREVIETNVGSYMRRMYTSKLKKTNMGFGIKDYRLRLNGLKHKKDLSDTVLKQLGEIKEPALPTASRVSEISTSIANNKLFNQVSKNPEWVSNTNTTGNLIKMADTPSLGALKGKFVVPEIAEEINAITKATEQAQALYTKAMSAWKYGKVVLNPATHARNMMSNSMLLDLSGTNHIRQLKLFPKAFNELRNKGSIYKNALDDGAIGGEFVGGDVAIKKLSDVYLKSEGSNLQKWMNVIKTPFKKAGDVYQAEEQLAKLVKYMDVLEKGGTRQLAAQEAQKWLFNYTEIPNFIKGAKHIAPFITFTYKSIPRLAESLVNNPLKIYKYKAFFDGINESSRKFNGMTVEEFAREKKSLPPWSIKDIGGMPTNLLMPWKDKHGRTQWLNLEYILPIGQAPEIMQKGLKGLVSNPLINIVADLTKNTDFKGQEIIPTGSTKAEAVAITADYIYRQLVPSLAPGLKGYKNWGGGYSFSKIMDAIDKIPDYADRVRDLPTTLLDALAGLKITPIDVEESEMFNMYRKKRIINDLKNQVRKLDHPGINEEYRNKKTEEIFQKIQRIIDEM